MNTSSFEIQACLMLEEVYSDCHAPSQLKGILVQEQNVIYVDDASDSQLLEDCHEWAK
jgi:hypothetical protein